MNDTINNDLNTGRTVVHVDMDAFYASIEVRDRPELAGHPVIVGGAAEGRGVVAAASYEARRYGIHSAMPTATARRLCPHAICLAPRMAYYAACSAVLRDILGRFTPEIEPLSLDEAFMDVTASLGLFGDATAIARDIKRAVADELGLVASVGVAPNKFVAKVASDWDKPDGLVVVPAGEVQAFLDPMPVTRLWGVGEVAARKLRDLGVATVADLRRQPVAALERLFGRSGRGLWFLARGVDDRPVVRESEARSLSRETTFATDIGDATQLKACLMQLTEDVAARLRRRGLAAGAVVLKLRDAGFRTTERARGLERAAAATMTLWQAAEVLFDRHWGRQPRPLRLIGVGAARLAATAPEQGDLFATGAQPAVDRVVDRVRERFGPDAVRRARGVVPGGRH